MAPGVADGSLARWVSPAGAVGDQLAVVADEQSADDLAERIELGLGGPDQAGADVVPESEVAAGRLGVAGARLTRRCSSAPTASRSSASSRRAPAKYASSRAGALVVMEVLVDEVDHERGVDDPDADGEIRPAVVREGVAAVRARSRISEVIRIWRTAACACGERVELPVDSVGLAAGNRRWMPSAKLLAERLPATGARRQPTRCAVADMDGYGQSIRSTSSAVPSSIRRLRFTCRYSLPSSRIQLTVFFSGSTINSSSTPRAA